MKSIDVSLAQVHAALLSRDYSFWAQVAETALSRVHRQSEDARSSIFRLFSGRDTACQLALVARQLQPLLPQSQEIERVKHLVAEHAGCAVYADKLFMRARPWRPIDLQILVQLAASAGGGDVL